MCHIVTCVGHMVAKTHQRANARSVLRSFVAEMLLVRAFIVYVRPIVEYKSVICSLQNVHDIKGIEQAQRIFTKRLPGLKTYLYARVSSKYRA